MTIQARTSVNYKKFNKKNTIYLLKQMLLVLQMLVLK
jgi:hypothetical protein